MHNNTVQKVTRVVFFFSLFYSANDHTSQVALWKHPAYSTTTVTYTCYVRVSESDSNDVPALCLVHLHWPGLVAIVSCVWKFVQAYRQKKKIHHSNKSIVWRDDHLSGQITSEKERDSRIRVFLSTLCTLLLFQLETCQLKGMGSNVCLERSEKQWILREDQTPVELYQSLSAKEACVASNLTLNSEIRGCTHKQFCMVTHWKLV